MAKNRSFCLGITGGIGSGKSYVCRMLEEQGIPVFYTDDEAKLEMKENASIREGLIRLIGPEAIDSDGNPSKPVLRQFICDKPGNADKINAIVHPQVKERARRWKQANAHRPIIAIECALLFESGFQDLCDRTVTVAAPLEVRINRVCKRDGITPAKAQEWISLQIPQDDKVRLADFCIINNGSTPIPSQIDEILMQLHNN